MFVALPCLTYHETRMTLAKTIELLDDEQAERTFKTVIGYMLPIVVVLDHTVYICNMYRIFPMISIK